MVSFEFFIDIILPAALRVPGICRADYLTTFMCRLSLNLGSLTSWNPQGLSRLLQGLLDRNTGSKQEFIRNSVTVNTKMLQHFGVHCTSSVWLSPREDILQSDRRFGLTL